jgi:hypothetical protein
MRASNSERMQLGIASCTYRLRVARRDVHAFRPVPKALCHRSSQRPARIAASRPFYPLALHRAFSLSALWRHSLSIRRTGVGFFPSLEFHTTRRAESFSFAAHSNAAERSFRTRRGQEIKHIRIKCARRGFNRVSLKSPATFEIPRL